MAVNELQKSVLTQKIKSYYNNDLAGKTIAVWVDPAPHGGQDGVRVAVKDSGVGIEASDLGRTCLD